jgi:CDGSH iron-sulfur domain-containing protein 3
MANPIVFKYGPIVADEEPGVKVWCACGRSANQPFCDGSHKGTGIPPMRIEIKEKKRIAWCACKHSRTMPFCDGSHNRLPREENRT